MPTVIEDFSLALSMQPTARSETDLASLVAQYSGLLFRVAHSVLRSRTEAGDVVQDTFVRVLEHRRTLHNVRDMRVWLIRIAWNLALDRRRRILPDQIDDLFAATLVNPDTPADQALQEAERMKMILREIDRLAAKERQVLLLSAIDELGTVELAAVTGRTESAVRALLFRARTHLRTRLEKLSKGATA